MDIIYTLFFKLKDVFPEFVGDNPNFIQELYGEGIVLVVVAAIGAGIWTLFSNGARKLAWGIFIYVSSNSFINIALGDWDEILAGTFNISLNIFALTTLSFIATRWVFIKIPTITEDRSVIVGRKEKIQT